MQKRCGEARVVLHDGMTSTRWRDSPRHFFLAHPCPSRAKRPRTSERLTVEMQQSADNGRHCLVTGFAKPKGQQRRASSTVTNRRLAPRMASLVTLTNQIADSVTGTFSSISDSTQSCTDSPDQSPRSLLARTGSLAPPLLLVPARAARNLSRSRTSSGNCGSSRTAMAPHQFNRTK